MNSNCILQTLDGIRQLKIAHRGILIGVREGGRASASMAKKD